MGQIHVHEFMSIDGFFQDPSWTAPYGWDERLGERLGAICEKSTGILLGRTTFEMFAPAWSTRTVEDDPGAPFFNDTTKYVVSGTLTDAESVWSNSEAVGAYDADVIRKLKDSVDGDLYISGSGTLVRQLLEDGLVDELHLVVFPLTLGSGKRLFGDPASSTKLERVACDAYDNGVLYLNYRVVS